MTGERGSGGSGCSLILYGMVLQVAHPGLKDCFYGSRMHQGEVQLFQSVSLYTDGNSQKYAKYVSENSLGLKSSAILLKPAIPVTYVRTCAITTISKRGKPSAPGPASAFAQAGPRHPQIFTYVCCLGIFWYFLVLL